jgi:hypothetical protein
MRRVMNPRRTLASKSPHRTDNSESSPSSALYSIDNDTAFRPCRLASLTIWEARPSTSTEGAPTKNPAASPRRLGTFARVSVILPSSASARRSTDCRLRHPLHASSEPPRAHLRSQEFEGAAYGQAGHQLPADYDPRHSHFASTPWLSRLRGPPVSITHEGRGPRTGFSSLSFRCWSCWQWYMIMFFPQAVLWGGVRKAMRTLTPVGDGASPSSTPLTTSARVNCWTRAYP